MAIGTNDTIDKFGTQTKVTVAAPSAVANNAFSAVADTNTYTNSDDVRGGSCTFVGTFGTAPTAKTTIDLYCRKLNVEGTNDDTEPDTTHEHIYLCSFPLEALTTEQIVTREFAFPNYKSSSEYDFYIKNNGTGQSLTTSVWELWITPFSSGPHA